jgi:hypothetical protein
VKLSDPVPVLLARAFADVCEAEKLLYASGASRETKDHIIAAHSHLLALKNALPVQS